MDDAEDYRAASRERWEAAATGWGARRGLLQAAAEPVSRWMLDAVAPRPGETVLELAAGPGDTGFMAAGLVRPNGRVITTDGAEAMIEVARARAVELGLDNVEVRAMEAEWIDLPAASVDAVLCRWGYMLLADPETALRETRRVLRPGGRLALAAWDEPARNPWASATGAELVAHGLAEPTSPGTPGMFAFALPGLLEDLLGDAGFAEVVVDAVELTFTAPSFDDWWEAQYDLSLSLSEALGRVGPEERDAIHEGVEARLAPYRLGDSSLALPARTLVASAEA